MFQPIELKLEKKDDHIKVKRRKGILLLESMAAIFITLISIGIFAKSYELLNESYVKINNNENNKSTMGILSNEIKYNIPINYLNDNLNNKDIVIYSDDSFLEKMYCDNLVSFVSDDKYLSYKSLSKEEYLNNYKNIIIKISKVNYCDGFITIKIKIMRKGCEKEEEIIKSSWMDEI